MATIKVTCSKCGKEFDLDEKWKSFAEKYPDRVTCRDCKTPASKGSTDTKTKSSYSKSSSSTKEPVSAAMFRKAYDELVAEFSDIKDDVKDYLGGWASTIVINRSR